MQSKKLQGVIFKTIKKYEYAFNENYSVVNPNKFKTENVVAKQSLDSIESDLTKPENVTSKRFLKTNYKMTAQ